MPAWVLLVAPTGIATIVFLTWWFGGFTREPVTRAWLERFFSADEPPLEIAEHCIGRDGSSALVLLADGRLVVVCRMGAGLAWRPLSPESRVTREQDAFRIALGLPTFPSVVFRQSLEEIPASIHEALGPLLER
ncbi:MAG: hypothetical protein AAFQ82_10935 [Myxococcota bacterium]